MNFILIALAIVSAVVVIQGQPLTITKYPTSGINYYDNKDINKPYKLDEAFANAQSHMEYDDQNWNQPEVMTYPPMTEYPYMNTNMWGEKKNYERPSTEIKENVMFYNTNNKDYPLTRTFFNDVRPTESSNENCNQNQINVNTEPIVLKAKEDNRKFFNYINKLFSRKTEDRASYLVKPSVEYENEATVANPPVRRVMTAEENIKRPVVISVPKTKTTSRIVFFYKTNGNMVPVTELERNIYNSEYNNGETTPQTFYSPTIRKFY